MANRSAVCALAVMTASALAGCGLGDRSMGSIFDGSSDARCSFNDGQYADGAAICRSGTQYRCNNGRWKDLGKACAQNTNGAESCAFNGRSYASNKVRCQSGTRYRCEDGAWTNLGTACKGAAAPRSGAERNCRYNNATVASQTTVCRDGKTSRCEDGTWRRIGAPCQ